MGDPSYTSKWRCKDCGTLYGHNPGECDVCGHTIFRPLPADGATETFEGGEEKTKLGDSVSSLVNELDDGEEDSTVESGEEQESTEREQETESDSLLSRLLPW